MALASRNNIQYCNTPQCKICRLKALDENQYFYSNLSTNNYELSQPASCKSSNCIYLISCKSPNCHMKYVGFTTTAINKRLSGHRANLTNNSEGIPMLQHFKKYHSISDMVIRPIEFCDSKMLRIRERFWQLELNTAFLYGLNDRIDGADIPNTYVHATNLKSAIPIYSNFNFVKNNRTKRGSGKNKTMYNTNETFDPVKFISDLVDATTDSICKQTRKSIMKLKIENIRKLLIYTAKEIYTSIKLYSYNEYLLYVIKDLCLYKLISSHNIKIKNKSNKFIVVEYQNVLVDKINLGKIIHLKTIHELFPITNKLYSQPGISYAYSHTIRSRITNYQKSLVNADTNILCSCKDYPEFVDDYHNHVITGDLDIITNTAIKSLLTKGLNYREKLLINKEKTLLSLINSIDNYINNIRQEVKLPIDTFIPWKNEIIKRATAIINKFPNYPVNKLLDCTENRNYLNEIHDKFVLVPIDKASNNISIICKSYYIQVLQQEILNSGNFTLVNSTKELATKEAKMHMERINLYNKDHENIPFLYWLPKMHKTPVEPRFITSGRKSLYSILSKTVSTCLKSLLNIEKKNCYFRHKYDNINQYYIINSHQEIIEHMDKANQSAHVNKSVSTFDFKTLYTNIPHYKLKMNINKFILDIYKNNNKKYINYGYNSAHFTDTKNKSTFTDLKLISHINKIIDNAYIMFNNQMYRQVIGIPMGTNCAPHLANIFLHIYEKNYVENILSVDVNSDILTKLENVFRYQDDLISFEDNNMFQDMYKDIYPREMILKNTNISENVVNYLDLNISINDNKYFYQKYDKTMDYNFKVIKYPNLSSNIPIKPAYGVFISQLVRFTHINQNIDGFTQDSIEIIKTLSKQNYNTEKLIEKFVHFGRFYPHLWTHFGCDILDKRYIDNLYNSVLNSL